MKKKAKMEEVKKDEAIGRNFNAVFANKRFEKRPHENRCDLRRDDGYLSGDSTARGTFNYGEEGHFSCDGSNPSDGGFGMVGNSQKHGHFSSDLEIEDQLQSLSIGVGIIWIPD